MNQETSEDMLEISNEIQNIQDAKKYIKKIPNEHIRSKAMENLIVNRMSNEEIFEYIKTIPDITIRDGVITENYNRIFSIKQKEILVNLINNKLWRSLTMSELALEMSMDKAKKYIKNIPDLNIRSIAMINFLKEYKYDLTIKEQFKYIESIPDLQIKSNIMVLYADDIYDLQQRLEYIESIPCPSIRQREIDNFYSVNLQTFIRKPTHRQLLEKQILSINNFINKFQQKNLPSTITLQGLKTFFNRNKIPHQGLITKQQFQQVLNELKKQLYQKKKKGQTVSPVYQIQQGQDFFGNTIINPVLGDDGEIYEKESLDLWFSNPSNKIWSNQQHDYVVNPKNVANPHKKLKKIQKELTMQEYHQYLKKHKQMKGGSQS